MSLDKATLQTKWWFTGSLMLCAVVTKGEVLRAAGLNANVEDFWSALSFVHFLVILGLWYLYAELGGFLVLRMWPAFRAFMVTRQR